MKITIEFNKNFGLEDKEKLKKLIDRENFNDRLKTAINNGDGLNVENSFGLWVYTIVIDKDRDEYDKRTINEK